jgi:hypothetical protein
MHSPKIAFFVSDKRHFDYFKNVFDAMQQNKVPFDMIVNDTRNEANVIISDEYNRSMMEVAQQLGYPFRLLSKVIESRTKYPYVVTTYSFRYTIRTDLPKLPEKLVHIFVRLLIRFTSWVKWGFSQVTFTGICNFI